MSGAESARLIPGLIGLAVGTNSIYYRALHAAAAQVDPGHTANSVMFTIDFESVAAGIRAGDLDVLESSLVDAAERLARAGADFIVITSNTGHVAARAITERAGLPVLDIRDVVVSELRERGVTRCGILSTSATREQQLYDRVLEREGISVLYPDEAMASRVDAMIFGELVAGVVDGIAAETLTTAAEQLRARGAEAIVLACTDMTIVAAEVQGADIIDSTLLHASAAGVVAAGGGWPGSPGVAAPVSR